MDKEKDILKLDMDCINCGQPAVAGSTLCVGCMVRNTTRLEDEISVKNRIIKELQREFTDCRDQLNSALRYGFERNQENRGLHQHIMGLEGKIREVMEDEKKGVHGDK